MRDVMVDLETMGTGTRAPICSIGAVFFDIKKNEISAGFYQRVDWKADLDAGDYRATGGTIEFWAQQSPEAQHEIFAPESRLPTGVTLFQFRDWLYSCLRESVLPLYDLLDLRVWGHGPNFDNRLLREASEVENVQLPWRYSNERDLRTLYQVGEMLGVDHREALKDFPFRSHIAYDDADYQARAALLIFERLKELAG
jgi:hypothetical protein